MAEDQAQPKSKGGRPRKHPVGTRIPTLAFRVRSGLRDKLESSAKNAGLSISEEIERRLLQSFEEEALHNYWIGRGPTAELLRSTQNVVAKLARMAKSRLRDAKPDRDYELATRQEIHAALDVLKHVYAPLKDRRPTEPRTIGYAKGAWGSGDYGRQEAYDWLWWQGDNAYEDAKGVTVDAYWSGNDERLGRLDFDDAADVEWRRSQGRDEGSLTPLPASLRFVDRAELLDFKPIEVESDVEPAPKRKKRTQKPASEQ